MQPKKKKKSAVLPLMSQAHLHQLNSTVCHVIATMAVYAEEPARFYHLAQYSHMLSQACIINTHTCRPTHSLPFKWNISLTNGECLKGTQQAFRELVHGSTCLLIHESVVTKVMSFRINDASGHHCPQCRKCSFFKIFIHWWSVGLMLPAGNKLTNLFCWFFLELIQIKYTLVVEKLPGSSPMPAFLQAYGGQAGMTHSFALYWPYYYKPMSLTPQLHSGCDWYQVFLLRLCCP